MKTNKLSHSSVSMYRECSKKYELHYIQKIRTVKTKSAFIFGDAIDRALNVLLKDKDLQKAHRVFNYRMSNTIINGKRVKVEETDLINYTKTDLDEKLLANAGFELADIFNQPYNPAWESLCLKGKYMIQAYYTEVLPKIKRTIAIQKHVSLKNSVGDAISGYLDTIVEWEDGRILLMDNKTSSVKYDLDSVIKSNQLALYHYIEKDNIKLDGAGFIVIDKKIKIVDGKPQVKINYIIDTIPEEAELRVIQDFDEVNSAIAAEQFSCNPGSCYSKFGKCVYFDYCKSGSMEGLVDLSGSKRNK